MDVNGAWKKTCTVLFGSELGNVTDYADYLGQYIERPSVRRSPKGMEIAVDNRVRASARVADYSEAMAAKTTVAPLSINDIKDMDSLVEAAKEQFVYSGNMWLGNCHEIRRSNKCVDSFFVEESERVFYSKYIYRSSVVRKSEYVFGSVHTAETNFGIKNYETWRSVRMLEVLRVYTSSDCYFCSNMDGCQNCLFCFNIKNSSYRIGNLQLEKGQFLSLKDKLVSEMHQALGKNKKLPTVFDLLGGHGG